MATPSGTITLYNVNSEFGKGYRLLAYRNMAYTTNGSDMGLTTSGAISLFALRSKSIIPAGSRGLTSGTSTTMPPYRTISFAILGAGGGGGGGGGGTNNQGCGAGGGGNGNAGAASQLGSSGQAWYLTPAGGGGGYGGGGGPQGANGAQGSDGAGYNGDPARAAGGAVGAGYSPGTGGAGGGGGRSTVTLTNPLLGGTGPSTGSSVSYSLGAGGAGGGGGGGVQFGIVCNFFGCVCCGCIGDGGRNGGTGSTGSAGLMSISWTGS